MPPPPLTLILAFSSLTILGWIARIYSAQAQLDVDQIVKLFV